MRYVVARLEEYSREMTYRIYIANSLQNIPQNKYTALTLYDLLYNPVENEEDDRTGDEIALDIMQRAGLIFGD